MPEKTGLEVAEEFYKHNPSTKIIFLTNYEQFVFYSLRFAPFRFIRKSMMREELPEAVQSAIIALNSDTKTLTLKRYSDYEVISLNSILYVEKIKRQNSLRIVLTDRNVEHRETVQTLEKLLTGCGFFRINSGTLVNMKHIKQISGSNITMLNGKVLPVAASKLNTLKKEFSAYLRPDYSV